MDKEKLQELLNFEGLHAVVLGDIMLDKYILGSTTRISPEAPVPIVELHQRKYMLGGAANVAQNLKNLGAQVSLIGISGEDEGYENFIHKANEKKFENLSILKNKNRKTTTKIRIISNHQHLLRVDDELIMDSNDEEVAKVLDVLNGINLKNPIDVVVFQDYNKGFFSPIMIATLMKWIKDNEIISCLDPKTDNIQYFKGVNVFKPNLKEFRQIFGDLDNTELANLHRISEQVFSSLECQLLMVTLGSQGVFISDQKQNALVPTAAKSIVDVSGAGDTVLSILALLYTRKLANLEEIAKISNYAGAAVCKVSGVGIISKDAIINEALS